MTPDRLAAWNVCVILNVLGAGLGRWRFRARPRARPISLRAQTAPTERGDSRAGRRHRLAAPWRAIHHEAPHLDGPVYRPADGVHGK